MTDEAHAEPQRFKFYHQQHSTCMIRCDIFSRGQHVVSGRLENMFTSSNLAKQEIILNNTDTAVGQTSHTLCER